ncbi:MAG: YcfL family protein [Burkholderiales bacterium]
MSKLAVFVAAALALSVAGCKSKGPLLPSESCPGFQQAGSTKAFVRQKVQFLGDPEVDIREMRCVASDGLLRIDIDIENDKSRNQQIEYRFSWYQPNGMSAGPDEPWKPLILYPDERRTIRTLSPSISAQDFKLVIKR